MGQEKKIRIGITGQIGFVGTHLYNHLGLMGETFERIPFEDRFFGDIQILRSFVRRCDVIVHLAAVNRHPDPAVIYATNVLLVKQLIEAMEVESVTPHVLFSSSTQEELDNEYGKSKLEGRLLLERWAKTSGAAFTGLVVPNVYGPFGLPNHNSFIATFCYKMTHGENPQILQDNDVRLIYVGSLCSSIIEKIYEVCNGRSPAVERFSVPYDFEKKVSKILALFEIFKAQYLHLGIIPLLRDRDEINLFNTFRSYIENNTHFPVNLLLHTDKRGNFVETIKLGIGGQVSFSTTAPGITRGNHYHTRKIERFTVIKGKARIRLRKVGTEEIIEFYLDGSTPSYVDMPIWYTHNITNIGEGELYTQFWINEWYDQADPDTYAENVTKDS